GPLLDVTEDQEPLRVPRSVDEVEVRPVLHRLEDTRRGRELERAGTPQLLCIQPDNLVLAPVLLELLLPEFVPEQRLNGGAHPWAQVVQKSMQMTVHEVDQDLAPGRAREELAQALEGEASPAGRVDEHQGELPADRAADVRDRILEPLVERE